MKHKRTWIVIADGAHAKVFEHSADRAKLEPVRDLMLEVELPRTQDIVSDRPGRTFESVGATRHAKAARSDPHRELKRAFAKTLADALKSSLTDKRYDSLVLVAPPAALGDLRESLSKGVRARVSAELARDLVKTPSTQIRRHLADVLPEGLSSR